ncbi:MAG: 2-oxoglutarate dehydrogenase E1 component [Deltaproteobacteria bacterium]|nr:2-oxoglutarate dehydrogenase E1 component [Deltaproteobacteria bacterium]MBK8714193.1 2-oxoglutarate dehydrogenase E1 component [Deltaproteobacteria bacterium]MBP7292156.1 2-oxoglutarate dehydrogenase E1 component [Nannocystaceae bacterium]
MDIERSLSSHNLPFLESLYEDFERDPASVDPEWRALIERVGRERSNGHARATSHIGSGSEADRAEQIAVQSAVDRLIEHYRLIGHMRAQIDPLGRPRREITDALDLAYFGLGPQHLQRKLDPGTLFPGRHQATLAEILARLQNTYTRGIGVEYWQINDIEQRNWLCDRMEVCENQVIPSQKDQLHLLRALTRADAADRFLHTKFIGAKRFSIDGAESVISLLDTLVEDAGLLGVEEVIFGMAHRGRLSVLMTLLGASPAQVFSRFAGGEDPLETLGSGDVKYHLGSWRDYITRAGKAMYLALAFNPSHLEAITPVIAGRVRASQDRRTPDRKNAVLGVTLHGDAAFMGQGVVGETLNLGRLPGYGNAGTIRIVINNQIGFTTNPEEGRSTMYPTAVADMLNVPVFHVNGDDPEAAAYVAKLAIEFRQRFARDVIINLVCYRRYGHNEGDEPTFTQPRMYDLISQRKPVLELYQQRLIDRGTVTKRDCDELADGFREEFEHALAEIKRVGPQPLRSPMHGVWQNYAGGPESPTHEVPTAIDRETIERIGHAITTVPRDFTLHPKLTRFVAELGEMAKGEAPISWAMAEHLAYGGLLMQGYHVRLSGQDCMRGTFTHRHIGYVDNETEERYFPLRHISPYQGRLEVCNSPLSEFAVMGFEFGYSLAAPDTLVIWEAQFGDFCNGAQVIIDQFLSSSEDKWNRLSGLVLLLPHGFEGQGPEHSSARLERFLQLAAEDNMQVCNLTTPAQMFHVLRRQTLRRWRKPLVIMSPKSLLRTRQSFSPLADIERGEFQRVIDDTSADPAKVRRVIFCSGKVYYDLVAARAERGRDDVAIVRIEQLYPFPAAAATAVLERHHAARDFVWAQEEPHNMGAWPFMRNWLGHLVGARHPGVTLHYAGRAESASPATGSLESHELEIKMFLDEAYASPAPGRSNDDD